MEDLDLHFTVSYRGKNLLLTFPAGSTVGELGEKLVELTGVAPHTIKLMLPKRPPLQPMSAQHSSSRLQQSGISEGLTMRMMGSSAVEVATVSQGSAKDTRVRGFAEEEELARRRASSASSSNPLPKGNYIFCDFRTLTLPGIELTPPPSVALGIMHKLASDRGINAIMNKYRWRVGVMTELAPVGYVGISPKCLLGFNKNRGEEISLRLRTDDLRGFRKYESIKKTLLHELAHMVHDEHDEKFHALDKKLNEEAVALDWTKSQGHTLGGAKFEDVEPMDAGGVQTYSRGYRLGGSRDQAPYMDPRAAAAAAALRRFAANSNNGTAVGQDSRSSTRSVIETPASNLQRVRLAEPDLDDMDGESMAVIVEGILVEQEPDLDDAAEIVTKHLRRTEPELVEPMDISQSRAEPDPDDEVEMVPKGDEPDPDDGGEVMAKGAEPDPDDHMEILGRAAEPDPDDGEVMAKGAEPDPDDESVKLQRTAERGPDDYVETMYKGAEPDPDLEKEKYLMAAWPKRNDHGVKLTGAAEPDPDDDDEKMVDGSEPDPDDRNERVVRAPEPDADDRNEKFTRFAYPDPDDFVRTCKSEAGETCSPTVAREYKQQCSF